MEPQSLVTVQFNKMGLPLPTVTSCAWRFLVDAVCLGFSSTWDGRKKRVRRRSGSVKDAALLRRGGAKLHDRYRRRWLQAAGGTGTLGWWTTQRAGREWDFPGTESTWEEDPSLNPSVWMRSGQAGFPWMIRISRWIRSHSHRETPVFAGRGSGPGGLKVKQFERYGGHPGSVISVPRNHKRSLGCRSLSHTGDYGRWMEGTTGSGRQRGVPDPVHVRPSPSCPTSFSSVGTTSMEDAERAIAALKHPQMEPERQLPIALPCPALTRGWFLPGHPFSTSLFPPPYVNPQTPSGTNKLTQWLDETHQPMKPWIAWLSSSLSCVSTGQQRVTYLTFRSSPDHRRSGLREPPAAVSEKTETDKQQQPIAARSGKSGWSALSPVTCPDVTQPFLDIRQSRKPGKPGKALTGGYGQPPS